MDRDRQELAARLRAAFAYADLSKPERANALGVSERTITRYESGETEVPANAWPRVLQATNVPAWFLDFGFAVPPEPETPSVVEAVEALQNKQQAMIGQITELRAAVASLVAADLQRQQELAETRALGRPTVREANRGAR